MNKGRLYGVLAGVCVMAGAGFAGAQEDMRDPIATQHAFSQMMAHLDAGGDLLAVANFGDAIEALAEDVFLVAESAAEGDPGSLRAVRAARTFLAGSGVYGLRGVGMSLVPRADGRSTFKQFIAREPATADLPLWRLLAGGEPRRMQALDFLPADAALVRVSCGEPQAFWDLLKSAVHDFGGDEGAAEFERQLVMASAQLGVGVESLIASLGDESFVSLQLSDTKTLTLPLGEKMVSVPSPSLLLGVKMRTPELKELVERKLGEIGLPLTEIAAGSTIIQFLALPLPLPVPLELAFVQAGDYLLLSSSIAGLQAAVAAAEQRNGLLSTPDFRRAFAGLPLENNGLIYQHERFGRIMQQLQREGLDLQTTMEMDDLPPAARLLTRVYERLMADVRPPSTAMVLLNRPSGLQLQGVTTAGSQQMLLSSALVPVGVAAAVAIPSFMHARQASQQNACINHLRMIDAAKEQVALVENLRDGDPVPPEKVSEYIRNGLYGIHCPQGGVYTLGAIGEPPTCSVPGHELPRW